MICSSGGRIEGESGIVLSGEEREDEGKALVGEGILVWILSEVSSSDVINFGVWGGLIAGKLWWAEVDDKVVIFEFREMKLEAAFRNRHRLGEEEVGELSVGFGVEVE